MDKTLLGGKIRIVRKEKGMTGETLAEICNINATYLRQIESGAKMPSLPVFISVCRALEASPSYLLSDILGEAESDELQKLWQTATPKQIRMISALIRSALENMEE